MKSETLDILFISYNESNGDKNWLELKARFPRAKRIHGIKGIRQAHQEAAKRSDTEFFFVVDGDNRIFESFDFSPPKKDLQPDAIYVYRCKNPVNNLVYGFGAVKIYNKSLLKKELDDSYVDFATGVTKRYIILNETASETYFFNTPEEAWRGAFRESFKLSSKTIDRQDDQQTLKRLQLWCDFKSDQANEEWVRLGARQGRALGEASNRENCKINDFQWLSRYFNEHANN